MCVSVSSVSECYVASNLVAREGVGTTVYFPQYNLNISLISTHAAVAFALLLAM